MNVVAYVSMAFGNPYGDPWSVDAVVTRLPATDPTRHTRRSLWQTQWESQRPRR